MLASDILTNESGEMDKSTYRRITILKEATKLFCSGGYSGTRMTDIAAAIGVTKPVVYRYYKSKEELFESWLEYELIGARDRLLVLIKDENIPARDKTKLLTSVLLQSTKSPVLMAPWRIALGESDRSPEICKLLCSRFKDPILAQIDLMFENAIAKKEIGGASAKDLTRLFLAPLASTAVLLTIFDPEVFEDYSFANLLECHLEGFWRAWGK